MAFPLLQTTITSVEDTPTSSHVIGLPDDSVVGNLLIGIHCVNENGGPFPITWDASFTQFFDLRHDDNGCRLSIAYRQVDDTEGTTITNTTPSDRRSVAMIHRIEQAANPSTQVPQASTGATNSGGGPGFDANPDPDSLTPNDGAKDYLWLAVEGNKNNTPVTVSPTDYLELVNIGNAVSSSGRVQVACAERNLNAAVEDPGAFTIATARHWVACTIAIHPFTPPPSNTDANPIPAAEVIAGTNSVMDLGITLRTPIRTE